MGNMGRKKVCGLVVKMLNMTLKITDAVRRFQRGSRQVEDALRTGSEVLNAND